MSDTLKVSVQEIVPEFIQLLKRGNNDLILSSTMLAVEEISVMYQQAWIRATQGAQLPGLPFSIHSRGAYTRSIERRKISPTVWEVFTTFGTNKGLSITELLEQGHGLIDLKPGLLAGRKSRSGKHGKYNIVAYRQGVPGTSAVHNNPMPLSVYKSFTQQVKIADQKKQAGARAVGGASIVSRSGKTAGERTYNWGTSFDRGSSIGKQAKTIKQGSNKIGEYTHKTGKFAGMVALQSSTQKARSHSYMTFRVVSAHSDPNSWIVPEKPPWPIRKSLLEFVGPQAEKLLQTALTRDIT